MNEGLEERVAGIEGTVEQMDRRLNHVETELSEMRKELRLEIGELRKEMRSNFRWTIGILLGILIPMWVTIILTVLLKG